MAEMAEEIDRRADMAACLQHELRRLIRDYLRDNGESTLTEIAHGVGLKEPHALQHLEKMLTSNIVEKREAEIETKAGRRRVTFYNLTEEYNHLFAPVIKEIPVEVIKEVIRVEKVVETDLTPLYLLTGVYFFLTLLSIFVGDLLISVLKPIGIVTPQQLTLISLSTLLILLLILSYYKTPAIVKYFKEKLKRWS